MDIRYQRYWLGVVALGLLAVGNALELSRRPAWDVVAAIDGVMILLSVAGATWCVSLSRRSARLGVILRLRDAGIEVRSGDGIVEIPWQTVRRAGRPQPGQGSEYLSRNFGLVLAKVTLLGRLELEHAEVLPDLIDFYARNEALRCELGNAALIGERMRRLRRRSKRRLRALERKAGTVRVRRPVVERSS